MRLHGEKLAAEHVGAAGAGGHRGHAGAAGLGKAGIDGIDRVQRPLLRGDGIGHFVAVAGVVAFAVRPEADVRVGVDESRG